MQWMAFAVMSPTERGEPGAEPTISCLVLGEAKGPPCLHTPPSSPPHQATSWLA